MFILNSIIARKKR